MEKSFQKASKYKNCQNLLDEYRIKKIKHKGKLLSFDVEKGETDLNVSEKDITIYNPTKPIINNGTRYLLARVEPKNSEKSKVVFFEKKKKKWQVLNHPIFDLQDPFYVKNIHGWQILGGVKIYEQDSEILDYQTVFYRYKKCATELIDKKGVLLKPFAVGPRKMKDIRLIELKNGKIGVFTRPQGGKAGLGKIAYVEINSIDELGEMIPKAKIIENQFGDNEWGGVNELHLLNNGKIGVLGHIACHEGGVKHYYAISFVFDPQSQTASDIEIIVTADQFPKVKSKKPDLGKIIFSGGLERQNDGTADLYVGIGDTKAGQIEIADPFLKYEYA